MASETTRQSARSVFMGPRLRRLRRDLGLTQADMAADLEISAPYVALLERNQRPVTADMLLRLARTYQIDITALAGDGGVDTTARLQSILKEPMFSDIDINLNSCTGPALQGHIRRFQPTGQPDHSIPAPAVQLSTSRQRRGRRRGRNALIRARSTEAGLLVLESRRQPNDQPCSGRHLRGKTSAPVKRVTVPPAL